MRLNLETLQGASLSEARAWIKDCDWPDLETDEVDELSAEEITRGVHRHYDGGLVAFLEAMNGTCL